MRKHIEELAKMPIEPYPGMDYQGYRGKRKRHYWEIISRIKATESGEPLESCAKHFLRHNNYYSQGNGKKILTYSSSNRCPGEEVFLRKGVLENLVVVDEFLKEYGMRIIILSGYRSPSEQRVAIEGVGNQFRDERAKSVDLLFSNSDVYSPHTTGAALDVEIIYEKNGEMLATKLPDREKMGLFYLEKRAALNLVELRAQRARRILHNVLATLYLLEDNHFYHNPSEYWHYSQREKFASFFLGTEAFYDVLKCPAMNLELYETPHSDLPYGLFFIIKIYL